MMKKLDLAILVITILVTPTYSQTHTESTSHKWKGIDVNTVLGNDTYKDNNTIENGYPFILYNIGTGRFVIQGGDWAMEGRLFYPDFGRKMYLYSNGRINAGITESANVNKNSFCVRPPGPYNKNWSDATYKTINLTTLMDGNTQTNYNMQWHFQRVEDESNTDTYTYYMYMTWTKSPAVNYYLGAAWGECHNTSVGKGDGQLIRYDPYENDESTSDDRCCWTTYNVIGATDKYPIFKNEEVELQKLYQWRLISINEFIEVLTQNEVGINPSISSLIHDRDFTRSANDFFGTGYWTASTMSNHDYNASLKRYTYTWADYVTGSGSIIGNNQQKRNPRTVNEPWDTPLRLKVVFDKITTTNNDDQAAGKKNAKYGFLSFEGVGTITTNFEVPKAGWYQIECAGFGMSSEDHDAYLFARVIPNSRINDLENTFDIPSADEPHFGIVTLEKLPYGTYQKNNYENCLKVGKELTQHANDHRQKVWVLVSQEDYDAGNRTIRLGFRKDEATMSGVINGGYYDTDWVCADDLRASYMGLSPVFFYEDEEDLNYLSHDERYREHFTANEYVPATLDGRYAGAANLQRKFTVGEWNTFAFPLPLTGEQIRYAFGDYSDLLKLNSIGGLSKNDCIIDFETVNLLTTDYVVTPGNIYLIKPTKEGGYGETPRKEMAEYYDLGKMYFSTNASDKDNPEYKYPVMDLSKWGDCQSIGSFEGNNDGAGWVTYTQTPGFGSFRVDKNGLYKGSTAPDNSYAPKGSYVMSGGKMYELAKDTRIKGFRGWITTTHSIFDDGSTASSGARIAIDGIVDDEGMITGIDRQFPTPINNRNVDAVYDLSGRRLTTPLTRLPRGLYIVNGKKLLVK